MPVQAVVYREHTLGYIERQDDYHQLAVWKASVLKGAPFSVHMDYDPIPYVDERDCRPATKEDFVEFNVKWHPDFLVVGS